MKKLKNGCHFINIDHMEKFQITDPPKFGSLVFRVSTEMEYHRQPTWGRSVIWNFSIWSILMKWQPFFNFFIMADSDIPSALRKLDSDIPFPLTLGKPETQTLGGSVIWNFSIRSILTKWQPFFNFFIMANGDIPFPSQKTGDTNFPSIQFSKLFYWFSFPCHPS